MKNIDKQIFDRQSFIDLAKATKLNVEHIRQLSDAGNHEIVVGGKLLELLIGKHITQWKLIGTM